MSNNLLSVRSLKKRFGGLEAVNVDKFDFNENQITSLIAVSYTHLRAHET